MQLRVFEGHRDSVESVAFSPDSCLILSGSYDGTVRLWSLETGLEIRRFGENVAIDRVHSVGFSPDGRFVFAGSHDGLVRLWNAQNGQQVHCLNLSPPVLSVDISPDSRYLLASGQGSFVRLWNVESGQEVHCFEENRGWVTSVAFSPDNQSAASGDTACYSIRIWDVESGKEVRRFNLKSSVSSLAFSPDGRFLISFGGTAHLWDLENGKEINQRRGNYLIIKDGLSLSSNVRFSPDGRYILGGCLDGIVRLWASKNGREVCHFLGHEYQVYSVAFSPDGRYAISGSIDRTVRLWTLPKTGRA